MTFLIICKVPPPPQTAIAAKEIAEERKASLRAVKPEHFAAACRAQRIYITAGSAFDLANARNADGHVRICFGSPQSQWRPMPSFEAIRAIMEAGEEEEFTPVA